MRSFLKLELAQRFCSWGLIVIVNFFVEMVTFAISCQSGSLRQQLFVIKVNTLDVGMLSEELDLETYSPLPLDTMETL